MLRDFHLSNEYMHGIMISTIILVVIFLAYIIFKLYAINYTKNTIKMAEKMVNVRSEVIIDIKKKIVYKKILNRNIDKEPVNYNLDDFIYWLGKTQSSKDFRELLKMIERGSSNTSINKKYKSLKKSSLLIPINYDDGSSFICDIEIDLNNKNLVDTLRFQISESPVVLKKNEKYHEGFMEEDMNHYEDTKLFSLLQKEVKNIKTKGWTLIKILPKDHLLVTWKDFITNSVQISKIRTFLTKEGIATYFSESGTMYAIAPSGRNSNHFSIMRQWNTKINNLLSNQKSYYFDLTPNDIVVVTSNDFSKDIKSLNKAWIKVKKLSETKNNSERNSQKVYNEIVKFTEEIHNSGSEMVKNIKENNFELKKATYELKERTSKKVVEFYLNKTIDEITNVVDYSVAHKKEIFKHALTEGNQLSKKEEDSVCTVMFDASSISLVLNVASKITSNPNFYISFSEDNKYRIRDDFRRKVIKLKELGFKQIQLVQDLDRENEARTILMNPSYVLFTKNFTNDASLITKYQLTYKGIEQVKGSKTKILSIK